MFEILEDLLYAFTAWPTKNIFVSSFLHSAEKIRSHFHFPDSSDMIPCVWKTSVDPDQLTSSEALLI